MGDLRPAIQSALAAFGLPVTVTRPAPDHTAIATTGIWLRPRADDQAFGTDLKRREPRRVLVVPRRDVPTAPRGTTIAAAEISGGVVKAWTVDGLEDPAEPDELRLIVKLTN